MKMKINSKDFRVRPGEKVTLKEWPTIVKRRVLVLQTLMRLKQVCNHPSQLTGDGA